MVHECNESCVLYVLCACTIYPSCFAFTNQLIGFFSVLSSAISNHYDHTVGQIITMLSANITAFFLVSFLTRVVTVFSFSALTRPRIYDGIQHRSGTATPKLWAESSDDVNISTKSLGKVIFLLPNDCANIESRFGNRSPYGNPSILMAAEHMCRKMKWFSDDTIDAQIMIMENDQDMKTLEDNLIAADALLAFNIENEHQSSFLQRIFETRRMNMDKNLCHFAFDCGSELYPVCGPFDSASPSLSSSLVPWSFDATGKRIEEQMITLFNRWTSDDFVVALLVYFNQFRGEVGWVKHSIDATWEKGVVQNAKEFYGMATKCGPCIVKCLQDENCKACLDALTAIDTRDQVASYRTIVSYESELLKDFTLCILQKNNIFGCSSTIPELPKVKPMQTFRGSLLTQEVARRILIGHLNDEFALEGGQNIDTSWKVAAGANVAYDQFPSQNQIFYKAASGKDMWYDPVFRVETIDGRHVWCKRHYRVRDGPVPGTFFFSVLDNGVTSSEFWTIVDCADDLSHIVFHYAGAASAVGQRYLGGLLCTADGSLPTDRDHIYEKLRSAGIEPWELFVVDNSVDSIGAKQAGPPPLRYFREQLQRKRSVDKIS